jgi:hypothetical protein
MKPANGRNDMKAVLSRSSTKGLLILLTFLSTSCLIVTEQPLIDPAKSKPDARLRGRWVGTGELKDVYALFDGSSTLESNIVGGKGPANRSELLFDIATGPIGKFQYISLKPREEGTRSEYLLARYTIEGDELKVWLLNSPLFDAATSQGRLKSHKRSSSTTLTDSPKKIIAFIVRNENADDLFQYLGTFKRDTAK